MSLRFLAAVALTLVVAIVAIVAYGCGGAADEEPPLPGGESGTAAAAANPVTVSPLPGTRDASAASQISFLGGPGTKVSDVRVVGSRSGAHAGVLRPYSTGTGESFLPARPFLDGERVTVRARMRVGAHTRAAISTFTIGERAAVSRAQFARAAGDPRAVEHYLSAPALSPSTVTIATPARPGASAGYLFLAPYQGQGAHGPMITDQSGDLVWFHPLPAGEEAASFGVQRYAGAPVLTWWQGRILQLGFGEGEGEVYDRSYRRIAEIRAGNGYQADLHVLRLTSQGTAWIDAFDPIHVDLSSVHGARDGILSDSVIQEIDIRTGLVMWEWHALGHVPVSESNTPPPAGSYPWDYVHVNSLDPGPAGDVLLSARNTWALYDVDIHSGGVRWRLGGRNSSFKLAPGARFYWQHDGEFHAGGLISVFDNGADPPEEKQSRALLLGPDIRTHSASVVKRFINPARTLLAPSQGNALALSGGNWLVGYGGLPSFTEFGPSGRVLLDASLGKDVQDFTTSLARWSGRPRGAPALAIRLLGASSLMLAASWNGATRVASWRVLRGETARSLRPLLSTPKQGFETTIEVPLRGRYVAVQALDRAGAVLGTSAVLRG
jgi:hypothetical protein